MWDFCQAWPPDRDSRRGEYSAIFTRSDEGYFLWFTIPQLLSGITYSIFRNIQGAVGQNANSNQDGLSVLLDQRQPRVNIGWTDRLNIHPDMLLGFNR